MVTKMTPRRHRPEPQDESALLSAARLGDRNAFEELVGPHRRELHVHCYRMTASLDDADDMLQETLLKAWRGIGSFEPRAPLRAWLYKIATNTCLNELAARRRPRFLRRAEWSGGPPLIAEVEHLQPYPDRLLDQADDPATHVARREDVALAFVAAIQLLPPRQRAVLLLRDVLAWSAKEVAVALDSSVASVNSALQRARGTLKTRFPGAGPPMDLGTLSGAAEKKLLTRFIEAWEAADFDRLASLLQEDAVLAMPPIPLWFRGRREIIGFLSTEPAGGRLQDIRLVTVSSNRQPAVAAFIVDAEEGGYLFYGLMVFSMENDAISGITGFPDSALGDRFELPSWIPGEKDERRHSLDAV
jgi:RNA polymerase sigma-70 factor (ECF subfamily)